MTDDWKSGDKFETKYAGRTYLWDFGKTRSGVWIASCDALPGTVQEDSLPELREAADEVTRLMIEDEKDDAAAKL